MSPSAQRARVSARCAVATLILGMLVQEYCLRLQPALAGIGFMTLLQVLRAGEPF
jgi:hypothetical protein